MILLAVLFLEFYGKIFELGFGYYLKWQNHKRPQLGRVWERDREALVAKRKIQSIRSFQDLKKESTESIDSLKLLFERVEPAFPLAVSRKKFLQLYYDFPGAWSERIVSPFELIKIDARSDWERVLLTRFGPWITLGFLDAQNIPIHEIYLSVNTLFEVQSTRNIKRGSLEKAGFHRHRIFPINKFLPLLETLDPQTRKEVFPRPRWFLSKDFHITRVGVKEKRSRANAPRHVVFGIEYDTDYHTDVLLIPVPLGIANNILSQIERTGGEHSNGDLSYLSATAGASP